MCCCPMRQTQGPALLAADRILQAAVGREAGPRPSVNQPGWDMAGVAYVSLSFCVSSAQGHSLGLCPQVCALHLCWIMPQAPQQCLTLRWLPQGRFQVPAQRLPRLAMHLSTWLGLCIPHRSGVCLQTVLERLMQRYEETGTAYLNISLLRQMPSQLLNPGPAPSVAGDLQLVEDVSNEGQLQLYFQLPRGRTLQVVQYDQSMQAYLILEDPW